MRCFGSGAALLLGAALVNLLMVTPNTTAASAQPAGGVAAQRLQVGFAAASPNPPQAAQAGGALGGDDGEESEYEEAPEDLPIPSAFARRAPVPPPAPPPQPKPATPEGPNVPLQMLLAVWASIVKYRVVDVTALLLFLIVVAVAIRGKSKNLDVASQWLQNVRELLSVQFAAVAESTKGAFTARSYHSFELFCSGRRNCMFMLATLECVPRQCLWRGHVLKKVLGDSGDLVTLEFVLPDAGEGMVVNICKRLEQRNYIEAAWDILEFCKVRHASSVASQLPEGFVMLADTQEAAEKFLDIPGFQKHLMQLAPYLKCIYTSDLCTNTNPALTPTIAAVFGSTAAAATKPKRVLRMCYYLPEKNEDFDPRLPVAVACKLVDAMASIRLSEASRESVRKLRLAYEKEQQKHRRKEQQEAAEKRKIEKKKQAERALDSLPEEQRRKALEAQERRAIREQRKEQRQGIRVVRA